MSTTALNHLMTLLKYALVGLVVGALVVALVAIIVSGPSSFFSNQSSWLGTEKQWARGILWYLTVRGFCGVGTFLLTLPSQTTIGRLFSKMGLEIDFGRRTPSASDLAQLAAHIAICASIVYLVGYGLEKLVSSCVGFFRRSSS